LQNSEDKIVYQNKKLGELQRILDEHDIDTGLVMENLREQKDMEKRKQNRLGDLTRDYNKLSQDM
jgi:hypothetical protein